MLAEGITSDWAPWSTSFLKAEGKAPPRKQEGPDDNLQEGVFKADRWTCQHTAQALVDKDPGTAWAEGAKGDGLGEIVLAPVDPRTAVWIWGGLGYNQKLFEANARPRKVRVWLLGTSTMEAGQTSTVLKDLTVAGKREVELKDQNDYQELPLPEVQGLPAGEARFVVAVEILSVYPGKRFPDLCISELGNEKAEPKPKPAVLAPAPLTPRRK